MNNNKKLLDAIKSLIVIILVLSSVYVVIKFISTPFYMWGAIFFIMLASLILTSTFLKEEPLEFFDDFGKWEKAKISSVIIIVAAISFIGLLVSIVKK